jgi:DNA-binding CsgD family transcriptional regulator
VGTISEKRILANTGGAPVGRLLLGATFLHSSRVPESLPIGAEYPREALPSSLSAREVEVLRLVSRAQTNQQIAENLLLSVSTVKKHVRQIISKLEVSDRTQAAIRALELGLRPDRTPRWTASLVRGSARRTPCGAKASPR